jgi:hypothetical protein
MDTLTDHIEFKEQVYIPYTIEHLNRNSYIVYLLENLHGLRFIGKKRLPREHIFKGAVNWNKRSYLFYEVSNIENEFLSNNPEDLWKVTPYEILNTREVTDIPIHEECVEFFKKFPEFCMVEGNEVPVVLYLGIGVSEIKEQILLQNKNEKKGLLGQGFYFSTYDKSLKDAIYKEETDDYLIHLENPGLTDQDIHNTGVYIENHKFYHQSHYLGDVPSCSETIKYSIYYYDKDVIYLKSLKPNKCKKEITKRKEDGYVMRYIVFLKKHCIGKKKMVFDSYAYDSLYMVKSSDNFICLSYHSIKKK